MGKKVEFCSGVSIRSKETQYGEILYVGINWLEFQKNPLNKQSYVNFAIKKGKSGKYYAELNQDKAEPKF